MGNRKGLLYRKALADAKEIYKNQGNTISQKQVKDLLNCRPARDYLKLIVPKELNQDLDLELADELIISIEEKLGFNQYLSYRQIARISFYISFRMRGIYIPLTVMKRVTGISSTTLVKYRRKTMKALKLKFPDSFIFYFISHLSHKIVRMDNNDFIGGKINCQN